jgi:ABC-type methionine transport system permease subunit
MKTLKIISEFALAVFFLVLLVCVISITEKVTKEDMGIILAIGAVSIFTYSNIRIQLILKYRK